MLQEMNDAEIWILAVTDQVCGNWMVWGDLRHQVECDYQAATTGRWPLKKPLYRVIARRK